MFQTKGSQSFAESGDPACADNESHLDRVHGRGGQQFTQGESEPESLAATFKYSDLHFASTVPGPGVTRGRVVTSEQLLCQQCSSLCVIVILVSRSLIDPGHVVTSWPMIHRQGQRGE